MEGTPHEHRFRDLRRPSKEVGREVHRWPGVKCGLGFKHSTTEKERFDPGYYYEPEAVRYPQVEEANIARLLRRERYRGPQMQKDFSFAPTEKTTRLRAQVFTDSERVNEQIESFIPTNDGPYQAAPTFIFRADDTSARKV